MAFSIPSSKTMACRMVTEIIALIVLTYPFVHIRFFNHKEPERRGFFCDDDSIRYPLAPESITTFECFAIWAVIAIVTVGIVESFSFVVFRPLEDTAVSNQQQCKIPNLVLELYRIFAYFTLGGLFSMLIVEMSKYTIGRLRPHFYEACQPLCEGQDCCSDPMPYPDHTYITNYTCSYSPNSSKETVDNARVSFMSGHTSFSFYSAFFLVLYLQVRLCDLHAGQPSLLGQRKTNSKFFKTHYKGIRIVRPFVQFGLLALAGYVGLTRISDFKHHPGDVLTGSVFGSIIAWCMVYAVMKLPQHPRIFYTMATINSENFQPLPQYTDLVDQGRAQPSSQTSIALQPQSNTRQI